MEGQADFTERETNGETVLHFTGRLTVARIVDLDDRLTDMAIRPAKADISEVERVDTVGAWILHKLKRDYGTKIVGASNNAERLIDQVASADEIVQVRPDEGSAFSRTLARIGAGTMEGCGSLRGLLLCCESLTQRQHRGL